MDKKRHLVSELYGIYKNCNIPAFIIGNGTSKKHFNIDDLKDRGFVFGCNQAFKHHHVDILGFRDTRIFEECMEFDGPKILPLRFKFLKQEKKVDLIQENIDSIFFHIWEKSREYPLERDNAFIRHNTGVVLLQLAIKMGFNPIVLIGFDCCAEKDPEDKTVHSNTLRKDNVKIMNMKMDGKPTAKYLIAFKYRLEEFLKNLKKVKDQEGIPPIYKLGDYGIVNMEIINLETILKFPRVRESLCPK